MAKTTVTIEVEINFPEGKRKIEMVQKKGYEIEDCEEGKVVILILADGQELTGIFKGMADNDVKITSVAASSGKLLDRMTLGYNINWVSKYFEELKN